MLRTCHSAQALLTIPLHKNNVYLVGYVYVRVTFSIVTELKEERTKQRMNERPKGRKRGEKGEQERARYKIYTYIYIYIYLFRT